MFTGGTDGAVRLWNVQKEKEFGFFQINGQKNEIKDLVFSPNGRWLAIGSFLPNIVTIVDVNSKKIINEMGNVGNCWGLNFSPDGKWLFVNGSRLYETETWEGKFFLDGSIGKYYLRFSPDGRWLTAGGRHCMIKVWDWTKYQKKLVLSDFEKMLRRKLEDY